MKSSDHNPSYPQQTAYIYALKYLRMTTLLFVCSLLSLPLTWAQEASTSNCTSLWIKEKNDQQREITIKRDGSSFNVQINGFITLSDDDTDVIAISGGGFLKISKSAFGSKRKLSIEADRNGGLVRKYQVGWREQDYEPEGRAWLAEILPEIVRSSGVGAEDRVNRIYDRGGMTALSDEIRLLEGDYVKALYLELVLCKNLSESEVNQALEVMAEQIGSDHYMAELMSENFALFTSSPARMNAYIDACRKIESDHYLTEVLEEAVESRQVSDEQLASLLRAAQGIESDHYMASLLTEMLDSRNMNDANLTTLLQLGETIESDHYQTEVLQEALQTERLSEQAVNRLLQNVGAIESDHYITEVITDLVDERELAPGVANKLLGIIGGKIESAHYQSECLQAFVEEQGLSTGVLPAFVGALSQVNSDNYITEVLEEVTGLSSLSDEDLIQLLQACGRINSDHYLTETLSGFAGEAARRGGAVKEAYMAAARRIESETYFGQAVRAVE